ncbi:hypothetical protein Tco_0587811 [Tanacetum coccineum]
MNDNVVAARAEGQAKEKDVAYLSRLSWFDCSKGKKAGIQLQAEDLIKYGCCSGSLLRMRNVEQDGETVEQHPATVEETHAYFESLYNNWAIEAEKLNMVNRKQNFKIQFLKEAAKFVRDFKSLAKEADESLTKHKALELEIKCLLRAIFSQDIMSIVQNNSVVDTSNLQTELDHTKERFENCIIKNENEYAKTYGNDWYKKCEECKYDKISYDKAYNDMQQKIKQLQAQLGDLKGKSKDTPCVSNTLDPLS